MVPSWNPYWDLCLKKATFLGYIAKELLNFYRKGQLIAHNGHYLFFWKICAHYRQKKYKFLYTVLQTSQSWSGGSQHKLSLLSLLASISEYEDTTLLSSTVPLQHLLGSHLKSKLFYHNQSASYLHEWLTVISTTSFQKPDWIKKTVEKEQKLKLFQYVLPTLQIKLKADNLSHLLFWLEEQLQQIGETPPVRHFSALVPYYAGLILGTNSASLPVQNEQQCWSLTGEMIHHQSKL